MPESAHESDEALMSRYQAGEYEAFEELYRRHAGRVYGFLAARLKERVMCDDVFQETWSKLHRFRGRYDARLSFKPWLFTVCRNVLLDHLRAYARLREQPIADLAEDVSPRETPFQLSAALPTGADLSARDRELLALRVGEDLTYHEIARRLGTSPTNARQLFSRLVRRLRKVLGGGS